ncbi:MAG: hypothetical protein PHC53_03970 [Patescibacteria group bacterium]|nr:hypothetical protein [Patescibacteria group bacterium]
MSPRCMLSVVFLHVWRGRALSLIAFLLTLLAPLAALADDNPYHDPDLCIRGGQNVTVDGKMYTKININGHLEQENPRQCSLRTAHPMYPILGDSGKPLGQQEWLRSVYAANQGTHPTVLRKCVPNSSPSPNATAEELAECPHSFINYMDVPSNGWIAWILIPRQPVSTWGEKQTSAAKSACSEATSDEAKKNCQIAGFGQAEKGQPLVIKTPTFQDELNLRLMAVEVSLFEGSLSLALTQNTMIGEHNRKVAYVWLAVAVLLAIALTVVSLAAASTIRSLIKQLKEARQQKTLPTGATLSLQNKRLQEELEKANQTIHRLSSVDHGLELDLLRQQHNAELAEVNRQKGKEITGLREELSRKNREVQNNDHLAAQFEGQAAGFQYRARELVVYGEELQTQNGELVAKLKGQAAGFQYRIKELENKQAANDNEFIALLAEKDQTIAAIMSRVEELQAQLKAANDNAAQATPPTTVTTPPTTETITPPTTETEQPATTQRGFPAVTPPADPGQPQPTQQRDLQSEADAFKSGMPEIIFLLGGDPQVLVDAEPEAIMIRAIELASDKNAKVVGLESSLKDARDQRKTAEEQVSAHKRTIGQLNVQVEQETQAKVQAISREIVLQEVVDGFQDKATEPEKKVLEALFKAAQLGQDVATLQFSVHKAETGQQVAERERDQATGACYQLNLLYMFSQIALQKAVSGSDCVPGVQASESWAGPEAVTVPKRATLSPQVEHSTVISKDQLDQGQAGQQAVTPFVRVEPSPHPRTIPMPPPRPEPEPEKSGQGNG